MRNRKRSLLLFVVLFGFAEDVDEGADGAVLFDGVAGGAAGAELDAAGFGGGGAKYVW